MYTLKGIFPEPKKEQKKNFIKENMKQLKYLGKSKQTNYVIKHQPRFSSALATGSSLGQVKSTPSNKSGKVSLHVGKSSTNSRKRSPDHRIRKGDMAEFLKRKEQRQVSQVVVEDSAEEDIRSTESSGNLKDMGCQTVDLNLAKKFAESTKLTMLYPRKEEEDAKLKASGDNVRHLSGRRAPESPQSLSKADDELLESERHRSRLNAILDRKDKNTKDPYLPAGYQKGVLPKYLKERKEQGLKEAEGIVSDDSQAICPPGHVTLPDNERKETLRMLRNSFAELVSELNKMPVKTDTLRMRNRKMELEKQLSKLEEGIKVFSRPKVFVKIGE